MLECALIIPDTHRPYHDRRAYKLMIKVAKSLKKYIKEIVILGDYADFYCVSSHQRHPTVLNLLQDEVKDVISGIKELEELFPRAKKVFIEGNHEYRLERYLVSQAPALFGVTETENVLKLQNWKFVPYGPNQKYKILGSKLVARHEPLGSSAKATASKSLCSLVYGHIHRIEESHLVGLDGTNHVVFSVGWLGDKRMDKIFGYTKGHQQWQLGFGLAWVDTATGYFYHQKIHILDNYTCLVNGVLFKL